jgi:hypothetical protein
MVVKELFEIKQNIPYEKEFSVMYFLQHLEINHKKYGTR